MNYINYPLVAATDDLKSAYLQPTIQNALRTDFYRAVWSNIDTTNILPETLDQLPIVSKEAIRKAGRSGQVRDGLKCTEFFTMGTTGIPLVTVRGNREKEFIRQFFKGRRDVNNCRDLRALYINNPYHGDSVSIPNRMHTHRIGVYDKGSFEHAREVLINSHQDWMVEPYCTQLIGLERCLRALTHDTRVHFPHGLPNHLEYMVSFGEYLTPRWRCLFEETWQCQILDRYSLSEIFGGATQDPNCGWYFFDPFVIPEVICSNTHEVTTEGVGLLVLTALYPFQEAQPLVRYLTGDLVAVTHTKSSRPGCLAIRPLGRAKYGVPLVDSSKWLVTPACILDCVDKIPGIRRTPLFRDSEQVIDPFEIGYPRYQVSYTDAGDVRNIILQIDVVPSGTKSSDEELRDQLIEEMCVNGNVLRQALSSGNATIDVVVNSELKPDVIFYST